MEFRMEVYFSCGVVRTTSADFIEHTASRVFGKVPNFACATSATEQSFFAKNSPTSACERLCRSNTIFIRSSSSLINTYFLAFSAAARSAMSGLRIVTSLYADIISSSSVVFINKAPMSRLSVDNMTRGCFKHFRATY